MATSSTVARWELAHRIKVRRNDLGIGVEQIAKHLGFTRNFFSAVENERSMLATDKLEVLLVMLDFDDAERQQLVALDAAARNRGWWESKEVVELVGDEGSRYLGLEQGASRIRTYDSLVLPGLLQIADYMRAPLETDPLYGPLRVNELVDIRLRRQRDISGRTPITALISEAALRQHWGPSSLQRRQLEHMIECAKTYFDLEIRVLTFDVPPGALAASSTLSLLDFSSEHLPDVCYQEAVRNLKTLEGTDPQYQRLKIAYEGALERSRKHDDSIQYIKRLIRDG